ncbi:MAG: hypothetical protein P8M34_01285 [Saprospiraceae bacterium]|nr:hypothetical protein [Saprospiraceae bacterium]
MKEIKLMVLVLSIICANHVDAFAIDDRNEVQIEKVSTLEILPVSSLKGNNIYQSSQFFAKRRKLSTTLRKPILKKYRSKNHNLC